LPTVERKSLGSEFKYKDLAVSFDEIIIEEIEKTNDVKITVKAKPILKIPLLFSSFIMLPVDLSKSELLLYRHNLTHIKL